jgi:hypothetical protein
VFTDPLARAEWEELGLDSLPVAVLGARRLPILHVDQLRSFLGLGAGEASASYQDYVAALERVLEGVERAVGQVPAEQFGAPTPNRGRDLPELVFNIHDPVALMAESLDSGGFHWRTERDRERSRRFSNTRELVEFCREVRLAWFTRAAAVDPDTAKELVATEKGPLTYQQVLEAQAFHAAQHLRQIYVFLRQLGVEPQQELTAADIAPIELGELIF